MIVERAVVSTLLLTTALGGYSFHKFQESRLTRRFHRRGVHQYRAALPQADIRYWAGGKGDGTPVLLIHGFGADALWGWAMQDQLAERHFLIAPDLLWFGESFSTVPDYSTAFQAKMMVDLLDHLAIDKVDVVGISYGGFITLELAHQWPERVRSVTVVDSPGHTYTLDDYHDMLERKDLDSVSELVVPQSPHELRRLIQLAYYYPPPVPTFVARDIYANMFVLHRQQKVRLLDDLLSRAATIDPSEYAIPHKTLVLWGQGDDLFPPRLGERLARAIGRRARFEVIPRTRHAPNLERALEFNRRLGAFLRT